MLIDRLKQAGVAFEKGMPIISFLQPVDSIVYGFNLQDYLESEFLGKDDSCALPPDLLKGTGIWEDLIW